MTVYSNSTWNSNVDTTFAGTGSSLTCRMKSNSNYYMKTCLVLWTLSNDLVVGTDHASGKALRSTRSVLMLDKQITNAHAAIEIAIGKDKLHAQMKINVQLPMPQQSDDRVDRASGFGSVDLEFDSESRQTNDLKIGIHSFPASC